LINNTGGPTPSSAATTTAEAWRLGYEQLVSATIALTQAVLPGMRERGFGRIITVTSTSVVEPIPMLAVSTAMRSAVTGFCKTLAHEVAAEGVTVHTVMPGVIHTARTEALRKAKAEREKTSLETELEKTRLQIPMKRLGKPEEFADVVVFLASARASYLTGLNIAVDGGARRGI
jgi:3-oxoacyl-[acyl-carrier protein] reductase